MADYYINKDTNANTFYVHNAGKQTVIHYWKKTKVNWTQPVLASDTTNTSEGTIQVNASSLYNRAANNYAHNPFRGFQYNTYWSWIPSYASAWWQVKFPYTLYITGIQVYTSILRTYSGGGSSSYTTVSGRFYTSNSKSTPIGNSFTTSKTSGQTITTVGGISSSGIATSILYFAKTGGEQHGGLGHIVITAKRDGPVVEGTSSDYDYTTTETVTVYKINKGV